MRGECRHWERKNGTEEREPYVKGPWRRMGIMRGRSPKIGMRGRKRNGKHLQRTSRGVFR